MLELLKGNVGNSTEPYVALLYSESYFQNENNIQNIFYNFITLAVHEGKMSFFYSLSESLVSVIVMCYFIRVYPL